jgi:uncharacterized metal-binding protein
VTRHRAEATTTERGQASVELALALPLLAILALLLLQVGLVVRDQVLVVHAAREAARAAAVDPGRSAAATAALASAEFERDYLAVVVDGGRRAGDRLRVTVTYRSPTRVPIVGRLLGDIRLSADATVRVEG